MGYSFARRWSRWYERILRKRARLRLASIKVNFPFYLDEIVLLSLLGGVLSVDERVGWQSLFSQPVFAATLVGFLLGDVWTALQVGMILELVWLSVMPMRATRRPDGATGAIIGAATACLLLKHTGDPRVPFVVSIGVFFGLVAGEMSGFVGRWAYRVREGRLGGYVVRPDVKESRIATGLTFCLLYSAGLYFVVQAGLMLVLIPVAAVLGEAFTAVVNQAALEGGRRWLELAPAVGAASLIHLYWQKHLNRNLVLFTGIILVLLWFR